MPKKNSRDLLDFIPLLILTISAFILVWTVVTTEMGFLWEHIVGLSILTINYILFFWRHKVGVVALGLTHLFGLVGFLSYSPEISTTTLYKEVGGSKIPFFYGQVIFLLWIVVHLVLSGRHYIGIATKKYWKGLKHNTEVKFD